MAAVAWDSIQARSQSLCAIGSGCCFEKWMPANPSTDRVKRRHGFSTSPGSEHGDTSDVLTPRDSHEFPVAQFI